MDFLEFLTQILGIVQVGEGRNWEMHFAPRNEVLSAQSISVGLDYLVDVLEVFSSAPPLVLGSLVSSLAIQLSFLQETIEVVLLEEVLVRDFLEGIFTLIH